MEGTQFSTPRSINQPVIGYPLFSQDIYPSISSAAATDNAGTVTGYPVSAAYGYPLTIDPRSATAANSATANIPHHQYHRIQRQSRCGLLLLLMIAIWTSVVSMMCIPPISFSVIPPLPSIALVSASAAINNVSTSTNQVVILEDLYVGFRVENNAIKGMLYQNIGLFTYYSDEKLSSDFVTLPPFEQAGQGNKTVSFRVGNMTVPLDDNKGDVVSGMPSGVSEDVEFEFRARIRYRGENWSKKEIPIQAKCKVKIEFIISSNESARQDFDIKRACEVQGQWLYTQRLMRNLGIWIPIAVIIFCFSVIFKYFPNSLGYFSTLV